jgi:hypothetical protein
MNKGLISYILPCLLALVLTACGGGGGGGGGGGSPSYLISTSTPTLTAASYSSNWTTVGTVTPPSVSSKTETYSDGSTVILEDGSSSKPFSQTTLSGLSITDPSKYVTSTTATYNLNWGTPDKSGPTYSALFPSASTHLATNLSYVGITVSGQGVGGPTLVQPSSDILAAWNAGWTGKGTNLMTIDSYSAIGACSTPSTCHGITTMMISDLVAPGASKFALDWGLGTAAKTISGATLGTPTAMNVINMSYATNAAGTTAAINFLTGSTTITNLTVTGAVLTKAAGNNSGKDTYSYTAGGDFLVKGLVDNANTVARLLIVGALDKNGSIASPASIASYSNVAGSTIAAQNRFVVANGNAPYANGGVAINGSNIAGWNTGGGCLTGGNCGTSYAAPVVAGYASVLMQKFPNITASSASNIILDTARTDTLSCSPNCNPAIYGKGEASLSRALAPVGRLR